MAGEPVVPPEIDAPATILVDWLELIAFFNEFGIARLDVLQGSLDVQTEEPEENIEFEDRAIDALVEKIENEIIERVSACGAAYPFELSDDAEELALKPDWKNEESSFYLVCLLASHLTRSDLLEFKPGKKIVNRLRNRVFQVISTFAMAGLANGSAASVGWPREEKNTVLETLKRAQGRGAGFVTRDAPGEYTPPQEKDGGVDVISWSKNDRPPPAMLYYGQVASGHNWKGKPVKTHLEVFEPNYFDYSPRGNTGYATLIPFRVIDELDWINEHTTHGTILDRTRLPHYAVKGLELKNNGVEMDEADNVPQVTKWIKKFRKKALDAVA